MKEKTGIRAAIDTLAGEYDSHLNTPIYKARNAIIFGYLRNFRGLKTLDVGCRTGLYALKVDPIEYVGIDDSEGMIKAAKKSIKDAGVSQAFVYKRRYDNMTLGGEKWPFIVALWDSLAWAAHDYQMQDILDEIDKHLTPGGRFFIMAPGEDNRDAIAGRVRELSGENITAASPEMLKLMFRNNGRWKVLRTWGIDYKAHRVAKYLPPFFLRVWIALETVIFKGSDRFQFHVVEGFKPLTDQERKELEEKVAKQKEPDMKRIRKALKLAHGSTVQNQIRKKRINDQQKEADPHGIEPHSLKVISRKDSEANSDPNS